MKPSPPKPRGSSSAPEGVTLPASPPKPRGSSSAPEGVTLPAVVPAPVKAGLAGVPAWWAGLSTNAKIGVGVGAVAGLALAYHLWSK